MSMQFDEASYLILNPDVAAAVAAGTFVSGLEHYVKYGRNEGRFPGGYRRMVRILENIDKNGYGIEIGASHNPIAPKRFGFKTHVIDHLDRKGLVEKYLSYNVNIGRENTDKIEEVDFVWKGGSLVDLIGSEWCYDWIIASHVIEHIPDLIFFLQQSEALLKPGGKLSLAVPDKRYCFDHFGSVDLTGAFLDAHKERRIKPSPGQIFNFFSNCCYRKGHPTWYHGFVGDMSLMHTFEYSKQMLEKAESGSEYIDVHCWKFTPESFRLVIGDLQKLGLLGMKITQEYEEGGFEFFVTLEKEPAEGLPPEDRLDLLNAVVGS